MCAKIDQIAGSAETTDIVAFHESDSDSDTNDQNMAERIEMIFQEVIDGHNQKEWTQKKVKKKSKRRVYILTTVF